MSSSSEPSREPASGLPVADLSPLIWRGSAGILNWPSDSGPEDGGRDSGVGRRTVNETLDGVDMVVVVQPRHVNLSLTMNESVLANTLRCWKQATHSYFRTSSLRPHALTAPCRTASYTPVQHPQRRRCSRPFSSKASTIPRSLATLLTTPTSKEIEEGEVEVDLIPNDQVQLMLTDRAAEVRCSLALSEPTHMLQSN